MEYIFDEIEVCECIGEFEDEYVYDIEMADETHTFIGNDILVHNSLYISYDPMLQTLKGYDKMSVQEKADIIIKLNTDFMDQHNKEFIDAYYKERHAQSAHKFELETLALSGVWLDVKKRYAQIILWKDGKVYDIDDLPMKIKGLEIIKSSYPKQVRVGLKRLVRFFLEDDGEDYLIQRLNMQMQKEKEEFYKADIEDICANMSVNNYTKYIIDDANPNGLIVASKCPANVRAAGNYNRLRNVYNLPGEPIYGGKVKIYNYYPYGTTKAKNEETFAFQATQYPSWADKYAPVCRDSMFQKYMLDPFNRILEANELPNLQIDGNIEMNLFDLF